MLSAVLAALKDVTVVGGTIPLAETAAHDLPILCLCCDSRKAVEGCFFFCLRGAQSDGHRFALDAYRQGCRAFAVEYPIENLPSDARQYRVADTRASLADAAAFFNDHPERSMRLIGITGTKGKTTTALILRDMLEESGIPTGYIGTNGVDFASRHYETINSTPESLDIYHYLGRMCESGVRTAVLEISSQALFMHRTRGLCFDTCVFTNLSPDHIGGAEHPTFEHYKACKHRLFTDYPTKQIVVNGEDPASRDMLKGTKAPCMTFGFRGDTPDHRPDVAGWNIRPAVRDGRFGTVFTCAFPGETVGREAFLPLPGEFNVLNALAALSIAVGRFGVPKQAAFDSLSHVRIKGRFETITFPSLPRVTFVIDYAHNGVSLASILDALRPYTENRLICLFGSVGGRTRERRPALAQAAAHRADLCILTSDNPASENPAQIIADIEAAFPPDACPRMCIPDRKKAIQQAVSLVEEGDTVLLAGKGHENYQLVGSIFEAFSERDILEKAVAARERENALSPAGASRPGPSA